MNPGYFWGGKYHIDQDLLQLLYKDHTWLGANSSSSNDSLSNSSFEDWEVSSDHIESREPMVQHHQYPDQIRGEGHGHFNYLRIEERLEAGVTETLPEGRLALSAKEVLVL
ncbi:hypothetical protein CsatB_018164 [Cannabis sativa]